MEYTAILALIPVIIVAALIVALVRQYFFDGKKVSALSAIPAVIVAIVAVMVIGAISDVSAPYTYDEDSGTLTIQMNVSELPTQPWDSYAEDVSSLTVREGVTSIGSGAFDSLTGLKYIRLPSGLDVADDAFGVSLKDIAGQPLASAQEGQYMGRGDGSLYLSDEDDYTFNGTDTITGLADATTAKYLVLPNEIGGKNVTYFTAFTDNAVIEMVFTLPGCHIDSVPLGPFSGCASLEYADLSSAPFTSLRNNAFYNCASLEEVLLPAKLTNVGQNAFYSCSALESMDLPSTVNNIGQGAFTGCTGITSVTFASGFSEATIGSSAFSSWTFYASDGTTALDKTSAAALAGKTFAGTASALVAAA